jgi:hypothetical protein
MPGRCPSVSCIPIYFRLTPPFSSPPYYFESFCLSPDVYRARVAHLASLYNYFLSCFKACCVPPLSLTAQSVAGWTAFVFSTHSSASLYAYFLIELCPQVSLFRTRSYSSGTRARLSYSLQTDGWASLDLALSIGLAGGKNMDRWPTQAE